MFADRNEYQSLGSQAGKKGLRIRLTIRLSEHRTQRLQRSEDAHDQGFFGTNRWDSRPTGVSTFDPKSEK
jgi:hypothetical protein